MHVLYVFYIYTYMHNLQIIPCPGQSLNKEFVHLEMQKNREEMFVFCAAEKENKDIGA